MLIYIAPFCQANVNVNIFATIVNIFYVYYILYLPLTYLNSICSNILGQSLITNNFFVWLQSVFFACYFFNVLFCCYIWNILMLKLCLCSQFGLGDKFIKVIWNFIGRTSSNRMITTLGFKVWKKGPTHNIKTMDYLSA